MTRQQARALARQGGERVPGFTPVPRTTTFKRGLRMGQARMVRSYGWRPSRNDDPVYRKPYVKDLARG